MLAKQRINPNRSKLGERSFYRPNRAGLKRDSYGIDVRPPSVVEENMSKFTEGSVGTPRTNQTSNMQRFSQSVETPDKLNSSSQYIRFESVGGRSSNPSNSIISKAGMYSKSNARAEWQFQTKGLTPQLPGRFWTQSIKLTDKGATVEQTNGMIKMAPPTLGYLGNTNYLIDT